MSFFDELQRRNVFRVAIAYVVVAWLILQFADVMLNNIDAPHWVFQVIMLVLVIGFPLILLFAWAFELTPEGLKREKDVDRSQTITTQTGQKLNRVIIGVLLVAVAYFAIDKFYLSTNSDNALPGLSQQSVSDRATTGASKDTDNSIAVLPFINMSSDKEQEYFSDGLSEELLNLLAKIPELRVTSRSSAFSFKGKDFKISDVGQELNVAHVLEGSVRKSGNQVRITAQLIKVDGDVHLWSETYDRSLDNVFVIQDEIAAEVVKQLKIALLGAAPHAQETNAEAYALYLKARQLHLEGSRETLERATILLNQAIQIDPQYVAAHTELSSIYVNQTADGFLPLHQGSVLARQAANQALTINPNEARAYGVLGSIALGMDNDPNTAARFLERGLEIDPANPQVLAQASRLTNALGRSDEAIRIGKFLVARDPLSSGSSNTLAQSYAFAKDWDATIETNRKTLALSPGYSGAHYQIGAALLMKGDAATALEEFEQEVGDDEFRVKGRALALHDLGRTTEFDVAFAELRERWGTRWPSEIAQVYAWTGKPDEAFTWLDKSIEQNEDGLREQFLNALYQPLHSDPRWAAFRQRTGSTQEQFGAIKFAVTFPE